MLRSETFKNHRLMMKCEAATLARLSCQRFHFNGSTALGLGWSHIRPPHPYESLQVVLYTAQRWVRRKVIKNQSKTLKSYFSRHLYSNFIFFSEINSRSNRMDFGIVLTNGRHTQERQTFSASFVRRIRENQCIFCLEKKCQKTSWKFFVSF